MSWVKAKLTELQKIRNAYSWAVSLNYPKKQIRALKLEYIKLLREDRELHPENHFTIDERIARLEKYTKSPAGTMLTRTLAPEKGVGWTLSLGQMAMPKQFFYGDTIGEAIMKAEKAMRKK